MITCLEVAQFGKFATMLCCWGHAVRLAFGPSLSFGP
jgi:hypothetical protein